MNLIGEHTDYNSGHLPAGGAAARDVRRGGAAPRPAGPGAQRPDRRRVAGRGHRARRGHRVGELRRGRGVGVARVGRRRARARRVRRQHRAPRRRAVVLGRARVLGRGGGRRPGRPARRRARATPAGGGVHARGDGGRRSADGRDGPDRGDARGAGAALLIDFLDRTTRAVPLALGEAGSGDARRRHAGLARPGGRRLRQPAGRLRHRLPRARRSVAPRGDPRPGGVARRLADPPARAPRRHRDRPGGRAVDAIERSDWPAVGELFVASHASMRDDFEISCPELDAAVEAALGAGAVGAG